MPRRPLLAILVAFMGGALVLTACHDERTVEPFAEAATELVGAGPVSLAIAQGHTCALLSNGAVRCWGANAYGQLGYGHTRTIGDDEPASAGGDVPLGGNAIQVSTGVYHSCALLDSGRVRCWGLNHLGQLGLGHTRSIGDNEPASAGAEVPLDRSAVQIAAGYYHTCALLDTGAVRCWGYEEFGQLGYPSGHPVYRVGDDEPVSAGAEVPLGGPAFQIASQAHHTCALLDAGRIRCWGYNNDGELGLGHTLHIGDNEPASAGGDIPVGGTVVQISTGIYHTCAMLDTGAIRCWGRGLEGQLGHGNTIALGDNEPASAGGDVPIGGTAVQISAGAFHNCALLDTGTVRCWGYNVHGELGLGHTRFIGDDEPASASGDVPVGGTVIHVVAGTQHTCALLDTGAVRCWGYNMYQGQLGYGHTTSIGDDEPASAGGDVPLVP